MAGLRSHSRPPAPAPLAFTLDGHRMILGARPWRWWLRVLSSEPPGCWFHAIPLAVQGAGPGHLIGRIVDEADPFDLDDLESLAQDVLSTLLGIDWWAGHRLLRMAASNWLAFDAWCMSRGLDVEGMHPGRLCAAVYSWRLSYCQKESDKAKLDNEVFAPPPLRTAANRLRDQAPAGWDDRAESAAFASAMSNLNSR